jgi:hypothetical protein
LFEPKIQMSIEEFQRLGAWIAREKRPDSAMTIIAIALGSRSGDFVGPNTGKGFIACMELLKAFPEMQNLLPLVATLVPGFAVLMPHWGELTELYQRSQVENVGQAGGYASQINRVIQEVLRPMRNGDLDVPKKLV